MYPVFGSMLAISYRFSFNTKRIGYIYKKDTLFFWPILVFVMFGILETWDKFTI